MRIVPLTLVVLLGASPAVGLAKPAPPKPLPPVRYICEDGTRLRVTFSTAGATPGTALVRILGTGTELKLEQAPAADGGRYTAGAVEFWDKGQTASFTRAGPPVSCRPKR